MVKTRKLIFPGKSIHQCFQWIYFLLYHTGFMGFKIKNGKKLYYDRWFNIYGYLYRLILMTGLIGGFSIKFNDEESYRAMTEELTPVVKVILTFECVISPLIYLEATFSLDKMRDKYLVLVNTIQTLDEQLQNNFRAIHWNYYKSARKYNPMTVALYGFYTIISFVYIFNITHCTCGLISSLVISWSYACITGGPGFAGFLFVGNMDMLRLRFRLIQKLMRQYLMCTKNVQNHESNIRNFKILVNFFKEYSCLIVSLNEVFGVISASGLFHDFALITSLGYLLCSKVIDSNVRVHEYVFIILFMMPRIYKVISLSIYGFATQTERRNCFQEIVKMEYNLRKSPVVRKSMDAFLHWRMHNNYNIEVGKTIHCNLAVTFLTLNSVVNYIMILIQLQYQQSDIVKRNSNLVG